MFPPSYLSFCWSRVRSTPAGTSGLPESPGQRGPQRCCSLTCPVPGLICAGEGGPGAGPPTPQPARLGVARGVRRRPERACQTTPPEKTQGGREAAWQGCSLPSCLHLPHSRSEVANCGNSLQPSRAGPGCWPAWFYRAPRSQSDCEELGQLSNFAKAAPFSFPRCYNKYTRCGKGKKKARAQSGVRTSAANAAVNGSSPPKGLSGGSEELRAVQTASQRHTRSACICLLTFQLSERQPASVFV